MHIKNICKAKFSYWNNDKATVILNNYIKALRKNKWSDEQIFEDVNFHLKVRFFKRILL